ncbi:hypothetical protein ASZ90_017195 [hydrocarbon metagenome]|uniref:Uncharacterized protein n=1 Tax=hydrocarbon metagenome TaxID=938273 RepID=A0A0W8EA29_9ZZZZ
MNTEKIVKEARVIMVICLIIGIVLLGAGMVFSAINVSFISNHKAIVGLSFIPLSIAFVYYLKLKNIIKNPQKMKKVIIHESDERLVALKNEADAKALKIIQGAIFLGYMGYTLMVPEDVFESVGWWILMALLFVAFVAQGVMHILSNTEKKNDTE